VSAIVAFKVMPAAPPGYEAELEHIARALSAVGGPALRGHALSICVFPCSLPVLASPLQEVAVAWALVFFGPFFVHAGVFRHPLFEVLLVDYVPFLILLWGSTRFPAASTSAPRWWRRPR